MRQQEESERSLSGLSTIWQHPDDPFNLAPRPLPRPPNWYPAHCNFPPAIFVNNTIASRAIKNYSSYVVDGFASCMPRGVDYGFYIAHELRKRSAVVKRQKAHSTSSSIPHGGEQDSSSSGNDPDADVGQHSKSEEDRPDEDDAPSPKKPKLDSGP